MRPYLVRVVADPALPSLVVFTKEPTLADLRAKLAEMTASGDPGGHKAPCGCRLCSIRAQIDTATKAAAKMLRDVWPPLTKMVRLRPTPAEMAPRIAEMQRWLEAEGFALPGRCSYCGRS